VPVEQVEDLPVLARKRVKDRAKRQPVGSLEVRERELAGIVVAGLVNKRECGSKILSSGLSDRSRFGCAGRAPLSAQAFGAAERKHEGPHPAAVLQAARKRVCRDEGDLGGARGPRPVAQEGAAVIEEMLRVRVEHLGERVAIVSYPR
jgi:hypothetical protein